MLVIKLEMIKKVVYCLYVELEEVIEGLKFLY